MLFAVKAVYPLWFTFSPLASRFGSREQRSSLSSVDLARYWLVNSSLMAQINQWTKAGSDSPVHV